jgi:hypothetical protein
MVYGITIDGIPVYNDYSPIVINGFPCFSIPKNYILSGGGPYTVDITVKNKYTGNTRSSLGLPLTVPAKPQVTLASANLTPTHVNLGHAPIGYSSTFEVFQGSTAAFPPLDANRLPGLYDTNGSYISVPRSVFPGPGTYYIKVRAIGLYDTGAYSNEITLTLPP